MAEATGYDAGSSAHSAAWSRGRLRAVLAGVLTVSLLLLVGLGYAVYLAAGSIGERPHQAALTAGEVVGGTLDASRQRRDRLAAAPMVGVPGEAAQPVAPTTDVGPSMSVPVATRSGPAGVSTGFPRSPQGAVGQLAQLEVSVLQRMSLTHARVVYDAWAMPGGTGGAEWQMTRNVQAFLAGAQAVDAGTDSLGGAGPLGVTVSAVPAGAMVKGTDGPEWTLACVLLRVTAVVKDEASIGYGYCERMQWFEEPGTSMNGRWLIAPGLPAALAPSTWPGTETAVRAGWSTWMPAGSDAELPATSKPLDGRLP